MRSLNSIGLGLSLTFGFLLLALMGEIYYLLWWKRRSWNRGVNEDDCCSSTTTTSSSSAREFMYMFCCKKIPVTNNSTTVVSLTVSNRFHQPSSNETSQNSINNSNNKDLLLLKSDGSQRLLFTIKEETTEDLESEDGTSARSLSSDLMLVQNQNSTTFIDIETPYLTPLSSPSMFTPPLTPLNSSYSSTTHIGFKFNPLFESSSDAELSRLKSSSSSSSPPPKFKFLQEAEDKFQRRKMQEEAEYLNDMIKCAENNESETTPPTLENRFKGDESLITIIVAKGNSGDRSGQLV